MNNFIKQLFVLSLVLGLGTYTHSYSQDYFSATPTEGCGITEVEFTNNVPSNGYTPVFMQTTGYRYSWDFGNGETSTEENPAPVTYDTPGTYTIDYSVTIDTVGFYLTIVDVTAVGCTDPFGGKPDVYIIIRDGSNNVVYTTEDSYYNNEDPPYQWLLSLKLDNPPYFLWVWDDDSLDANDNCVNNSEDTPGASTQIMLPPNNENGFGTFTFEGVNGSLEYMFTFQKTVYTYTESLTIEIYDSPPSPVLSHTTINACVGENIQEITASGASGNSINWYDDEELQNLIHSGTNYTPTITDEGSYTFYVTQSDSDNSCESEAASFTVNYTVIDPPLLNTFNSTFCLGEIIPEFSANGTNIKWYADEDLTQWINDGEVLEAEISEAGEYTYYAIQSNAEETCISEAAELQFEIVSTISADISFTDANCYNANDGSAEVVDLEGNGPFTFMWSNGDENQNVSGLGAGEHSVIIRGDADFCIKILDFVIEEPSELIAETEVTDGFCPDDDFTSINAIVSGGTPPYSFLWSDGSTDNPIQNVEHGNYTLTITDANSCEIIIEESVIKPADFLIEYTTLKESCPLSADGAISISVTGGTQPYEYYWSSGANDTIADGLQAGLHSVTVSDMIGCEYHQDFEITNTYSVCLVPATVFTPNGDGKNDTWQIKFIEMHPQASVRVFARTGQLVLDVTGYSSNWDGKYQGKNLPTGSYLYIIDLNDSSEPMRGYVDIIR
jgi:gliding motility-associated-like protein